MTIETTTSANAHVELQHLDRLTDTMAANIKTGFGKKVDTTTYEEGIGKKVDTTTYEAGMDTKVDKTAHTADMATKVDKVDGKQLSTNDYTNTEKEKLADVAKGAQVNVLEAVKVNGESLEITDKGVNIDLSEYAKSADLTTVLTYKGAVATYADLPTKDQKVGDVYNVTAADADHNLNAGENVAWNGTDWDNLGGVTDLSGKVDKETGKGLSANDFTDALKKKLEDITVATDDDMDKLAAKFSF